MRKTPFVFDTHVALGVVEIAFGSMKAGLTIPCKGAGRVCFGYSGIPEI
ncbi:protein of unknown function [Pseudodesulfovibrio profundus]|uniref:Uncharacterized protein n=1 Tax=Pseudodesulfovibrio profundus TaxID=57320 RepID=A0A2C8F700_9BACT|nr:protein of unknown function [Pseudodesulfovibrio profundus]